MRRWHPAAVTMVLTHVPTCQCKFQRLYSPTVAPGQDDVTLVDVRCIAVYVTAETARPERFHVGASRDDNPTVTCSECSDEQDCQNWTVVQIVEWCETHRCHRVIDV